MKLYDAGQPDHTCFISWAAYHASRQQQPVKFKTTSALMPLFREKSATVAMITHAMKVIKAAVEFVNPGQVPVLTMDQPLFTIGKQIQWRYRDTFGEDKYAIMLGALHTEMAAFKTIGDFVNGSGWTNALVVAGIASQGTAESFIYASNLCKTRHAH